MMPLKNSPPTKESTKLISKDSVLTLLKPSTTTNKPLNITMDYQKKTPPTPLPIKKSQLTEDKNQLISNKPQKTKTPLSTQPPKDTKLGVLKTTEKSPSVTKPYKLFPPSTLLIISKIESTRKTDLFQVDKETLNNTDQESKFSTLIIKIDQKLNKLIHN